MAGQFLQPETTEMIYPIRGIDRSNPVAKQTELTCPDALNCRSVSSFTDRMGGGTRNGHSKAFTNRFGIDGARTPTGCAFVPRTQIASVPASQGTYEGVVETWDRLVPSGASQVAADFGGDYICMEKRSNRTGGVAQGVSTQCHRLGTGSAYGSAMAMLSNQNTGEKGAKLLIVNYKIKPDMTLGMLVSPFLTVNNESTSASTDEPTYFGPMIRLSDDRSSFLVAYLALVQPGTGSTSGVAQLVIDKHSGGVVTRVATSIETITMQNGGIIPIAASIRLTAVNDTITAQWSCSASRPNNVTLTVENYTDLNTQTGGGVWMGMHDNGVAGAANTRRIIEKLQYVRLVPPPATLIAELLGTSRTAASSARYQMPTPWISEYVPTAAGSIVTLSDNYDSATNPASAGNHYAAIDKTNSVINGSDAGDGVANTSIIRRSDTIGTGGIDVRLNRSLTTGQDEIGPVFQYSRTAGFPLTVQFIRVNYTRTKSSATAAQGFSDITQIVVNRVSSGTLTVDSTTNFSGTSSQPCPTVSLELPIRWYMVGNVLYLQQNGVDLWSIAVTPLSNAGAYLGAHLSSQAGSQMTGLGVRFVTLPTTGSTPPVVAGSDVVVFTTNQVDQVQFSEGSQWATISTASAPGLSGSSVEHAIFENSLYCSDGTSYKVVNTISKTVTTWKAKVGIIPAQCQLVARYRGSIILARQPDNLAIYYISRLRDPLDWDFGATDLTAKAIAGTAAEAGLPPEPITALIAFKDDYFIFGCLASMWLLAGDPRAGGTLTNISEKTGILGPRAYCFDEAGNLFFMGSGGLYVMNAETRQFKSVGQRRLSGLLDWPNTSNTLLEMVYDSKRQLVHVFFTPTDGTTQGTHVVFDPALDAIWLDQYPLAHGPFAACEIEGATPEDRRFLMFGNDGYCRRPDDDADSDDGVGIHSYIRFPTICMSAGQNESMACDLDADGMTGSGVVTWKWFVGDSPADVNRKVIATDAVDSGTWFETDVLSQEPVSIRQTGIAHQLVIEASDARWTLERCLVGLALTGTRRPA